MSERETGETGLNKRQLATFQKTHDRILTAMKKIGRPARTSEIAKEAGLSRKTVWKYLEAYKKAVFGENKNIRNNDNSIVRIGGRQGYSTRYKLQPSSAVAIKAISLKKESEIDTRSRFFITLVE